MGFCARGRSRKSRRHLAAHSLRGPSPQRVVYVVVLQCRTQVLAPPLIGAWTNVFLDHKFSKVFQDAPERQRDLRHWGRKALELFGCLANPGSCKACPGLHLLVFLTMHMTFYFLVSLFCAYGTVYRVPFVTIGGVAINHCLLLGARLIILGHPLKDPQSFAQRPIGNS